MRAIIIDTETTGLEGQLIEVAELDLEVYNGFNFRSTAEYNERFKPSAPIEFGAMAVHNIIDSDLKECRDSSGYVLNKDIILIIGHNIDFDWKIINSPNVKRICTLALARHYYPELNSHNLSALIYTFLKDKEEARELVSGAHSALDDVKMTLILLNYMNVDKIKAATFNELYKLSEKARIPSKMPWGKHKGEDINSLPQSYISWLLELDDIDEYLKTALTNIK